MAALAAVIFSLAFFTVPAGHRARLPRGLRSGSAASGCAVSFPLAVKQPVSVGIYLPRYGRTGADTAQMYAGVFGMNGVSDEDDLAYICSNENAVLYCRVTYAMKSSCAAVN